MSVRVWVDEANDFGSLRRCIGDIRIETTYYDQHLQAAFKHSQQGQYVDALKEMTAAQDCHLALSKVIDNARDSINNLLNPTHVIEEADYVKICEAAIAAFLTGRNNMSPHISAVLEIAAKYDDAMGKQDKLIQQTVYYKDWTFGYEPSHNKLYVIAPT